MRAAVLLVCVIALFASVAVASVSEVDVDIEQVINVDIDVPTGPTATTPAPAAKQTKLAVALHSDEILRRDHIRCMWRRGVRTVVVRSTSNLVDNVRKLRKNGMKVQAFYSPHDLDSSRRRFVRQMHKNNVTRVWIRLTAAKLHNLPEKNFAYVNALAEKLTSKKLKVGIYTSAKSWRRLFGKQQTASTLSKYKLWLTGTQGKPEKKLVRAADVKKTIKAVIAERTTLLEENEEPKDKKHRRRHHRRHGGNTRVGNTSTIIPHIVPGTVEVNATTPVKPLPAVELTATWSPSFVRKVLAKKDGTLLKGVCHLDAEAAVRSEKEKAARKARKATKAATSAPKVGAGVNGASIVAAGMALTGKGTRYLYGGDGKNGRGIDCSHLVNQIYINAGKPYPYTATGGWPAKQFKRTTTPAPGDVILFKGHMAIYRDATTMIGSQSSTGPAVAQCHRASGYWGNPAKAPILSYWTWA